MSFGFGGRLPRFFAISLAVIAAAVPALSDPPRPAIESAVVDYSATPNVLTITGSSFGSSPLVNLDGIPLQLLSNTNTVIVVNLPSNLPAGSYDLQVGSVKVGQ